MGPLIKNGNFNKKANIAKDRQNWRKLKLDGKRLRIQLRGHL